jgi:hypothetical protein
MVDVLQQHPRSSGILSGNNTDMIEGLDTSTTHIT